MAPAEKDTNALLRKYLDDSISPGEMDELVNAIRTSPAEMPAFEKVLLETYEQSFTEKPVVSAEAKREMLDDLMARIEGRKIEPVPAVHRVRFLKTAWFRYAAAIIIIAGIGAYLWNTQQKKNQDITASKPFPVEKDIMPGSNRAILTLSSGRRVELDSAASETIKDGTLSIANSNGQLSYQGRGVAGATNTMSTPKGGQYQLTLSDGTKVWLNAASSLTYPLSFAGATREVSITGEAYFEVAKNPRQPFHVKTNKELITVLGTSFNVNTYPDEPMSKTSLIEGSIRIGDKTLQPGQALLNGKVIITNIEQDIAWRKGYFSLEGKSLRAIMLELARWYDLEVIYEPGVRDEELVGKIGRNLNLSQVLVGLQKMGIKARIENNRRVVIMR